MQTEATKWVNVGSAIFYRNGAGQNGCDYSKCLCWGSDTTWPVKWGSEVSGQGQGVYSLFLSAARSRKRLRLSEGMAKEMPAVTFMVLMPMTSPSWLWDQSCDCEHYNQNATKLLVSERGARAGLVPGKACHFFRPPPPQKTQRVQGEKLD